MISFISRFEGFDVQRKIVLVGLRTVLQFFINTNAIAESFGNCKSFSSLQLSCKELNLDVIVI